MESPREATRVFHTPRHPPVRLRRYEYPGSADVIAGLREHIELGRPLAMAQTGCFENAAAANFAAEKWSTIRRVIWKKWAGRFTRLELLRQIPGLDELTVLDSQCCGCRRVWI